MKYEKCSHKNLLYQRYSERKDNKLYIYVNRVDLSAKPIKYELFRHQFDNFSPDEVKTTLTKASFRSIKQYSDLFLKKPFKSTDKDLVFVVQK